MRIFFFDVVVAAIASLDDHSVFTHIISSIVRFDDDNDNDDDNSNNNRNINYDEYSQYKRYDFVKLVPIFSALSLARSRASLLLLFFFRFRLNETNIYSAHATEFVVVEFFLHICACRHFICETIHSNRIHQLNVNKSGEI